MRSDQKEELRKEVVKAAETFVRQTDMFKKWESYKQEVKRNSWDEYFILQAYLVATRSLDAQTQCGCVIVTPSKRIIATGYNSFIGGIDDSVLPNLRPEKYPFMVHSEENAILSCAKTGSSCKDAIVYVTGKPCINCFQRMHQAGISTVNYYANHAIQMVDGKEDDIFEVLDYLSSMKINRLDFGPDFEEKISAIKACR